MSNLKNSIYLLLAVVLSACVTSQYRILADDDQAAELLVSPERILLECEWLYDADDPRLYGFMMHVLDEKNTVTTISQGNTLGREDCEDGLREIAKILREGRRIYIAGRGHLNKPREKGRLYVFPKLGTYPSNGRSLSFADIANEHGACYNAYYGTEPPCPRKPFPTVKVPGLKFKSRK